MMYPELLDYPGMFDSDHKPPPYAPSVNGVPAISSVEGDEIEELPPLAPPTPPPAYPDSNYSSHTRVPAATATIFTTAYPWTIRNRVVRNVNPDEQAPSIYPGFAFCKFAPGKIETVIRLSLVVMLLVLIALSGAAIHKEGQVITDGLLTVDTTSWRGVSGWNIFVASVAVITEGLVLTLRYLNPSYINNTYIGCGGLDITKCVSTGIGLLIGCIITGAEIALAAEDLDEHCSDNPYNTDNNEACRHLQDIYQLIIAVTTFSVVCMVLLVILTGWDIIYIYYAWNLKVPVPRARDQVNHQSNQ